MAQSRTLKLTEHCQYCGARLEAGREVIESAQARFAESVFCDLICFWAMIAFAPEPATCGQEAQ